MATKEELEFLAKQPRSAEVDGQKAESHSLPDQIALDKYLASKAAAESNRRGFRISKMAAGGAIR